MSNDVIYSPEELRVSTEQTRPTESVTKREYELIQELIKLRKDKNIDLEYEDLDDYEVPPRTQFSMLKKPAVTIKHSTLTFNAAAIRMFEGIKYVIPMLSRKKKRLVVIMCSEEESASVEWARKKKDVWVSKTITSKEFVNGIVQTMGWDITCRYKALGNIINSPQGLVLRFDLDEAIMFALKPQEYLDPISGKMKKKQLIYYPDIYRDQIGKSYSDYVAAKQLSMFENLDEYQSTETITEGGEINE